MIARRSGQLVLVSSIAAYLGMPQSPAYSASKAAVRIYGEGLRRLVRQHGVRVTTVMPGFIDTPMSETLGMRRPFCWPVDVAARRGLPIPTRQPIAASSRRCPGPRGCPIPCGWSSPI
jgi:short-subunit dehydrogenase